MKALNNFKFNNWSGGKFVKISVIFLIIFAWVFSGSFQIWNNPSIPPKTQEVKAAPTVIFLTNTSLTNWTVPDNWNSSDNTIEIIGAGGGGANGASGQGVGGGGGASGAYAIKTNISLTASSTITIQIGTGGGIASVGGDTYFNGASCAVSDVCGKGGGGASGQTKGSAQAGSVGDTVWSGADGGNGGAISGVVGGGGGGGAGAGGMNAAGNVGSNGSDQTGGAGGQGDGTYGGVGGAANGGTGSNGTEWQASPDYGSGGGGGGGLGGANRGNGSNGGTSGTYGAGGAGGGGGGKGTTTGGSGIAGIQGLIVITYTPVALTVSSTGTQTSAMSIPSSDNYVGGAFTFVSNSSQTVSEIIISDTGTVNANSNISNLKIRYETAGTCTYNGDETLFNSTGVSFDASEKATATGTMAISTSQVCVYVILDVGSGASQDETLLIQITDPSTEVTVDTGVVSPATPVTISGTTTLETPHPNVHINTSGTQKETLGIPSSDNYLGGVFTLIQDETGLGSVNVTQIIISETGTVDADANLSNVKLFYKQEATCATSSIPIDASAFNSTGVSFSSSRATTTGSMSVGESQVCLYIQLDVGSGASSDGTLEIQIDSSSDVTVSDGTVSLQSTPLAIAGTTTLQVIISITVNPSSFDYGVQIAGGSARAINSAEVPDLGNYGILVTNNTIVPVDLYIYGNDATGDETWTLSAGALQYTHEFIKLDETGNPVGNWTTLDYSANKKILDSNVAASSTMEFDLQITTPGSSGSGTIVSVPVTVMATEVESGWVLNETNCNALSGWHWYTTNGRSACWSKTLADSVSWNKGVGDDTRVTGSYTCTSLGTYDLQTRMTAVAAGEWYKIVSSVNSRNITIDDNGLTGWPYISALAISDCIDGTKDLTDCGGSCTDWSTTNTWLRTWAGAAGKSALPYLATDAGTNQTDNDYWDACTQHTGQDTPLNCTNNFYLNRKVCDDGDSNYSWVAACGYSDGIVWATFARLLGFSSCSYQNCLGTSNTSNVLSFRVVVRP